MVEPCSLDELKDICANLAKSKPAESLKILKVLKTKKVTAEHLQERSLIKALKNVKEDVPED